MTIKELLIILNPRVPKRVLLFVAGGVWAFASYRVFLVLVKTIHSLPNHWLIALIGFAGYLLFFRYVFLNVLQKHTKRIISKESNWFCIFSFFDLRSYLLMGFMIALGILSTKYLAIPPFILSCFFVALSLSLLTSASYFYYYGIRYKYTVRKFKPH